MTRDWIIWIGSGKKNSTILPPQEKKDSYNTPDGGLHDNSQETGAVTVVAKTPAQRL